jgi:putative SOS response-associated peptidase YedK
MCGRYSLFASEEALESRFGATFEFDFEPRYNAAPGQSLPVVMDEAPDRIRRSEWGLVPRWADDATERYINARSETVARKPAFADSYEQRRCLVPADGFYEWTETENGKRPYRVAFEDDRPFAMAGLYERWTPTTEQTGLGDFTNDGVDLSGVEPIQTFTVLTTEPNGVVEPLHHRMAVILDPEDETRWLDGEDVPFDPAPSDGFHAYPVSTSVNNPANDGPELVRPVDG